MTVKEKGYSPAHISKDVIQKGQELLKSKLSESDKESKPFVHLSVKESYCLESDNFEKKAFLSLEEDFIAQRALSKLHPSALKVLLVIAAHTNKDGFAWISQEKIGKLVGLSRQQVGVVIHKYLLSNVYMDKKLLEGIKIKKKDGQEFFLYHPINCSVAYEVYDPDNDIEHESFEDIIETYEID